MSRTGPDRRSPKRFRFWQGQALDSRDLNELVELAALMKCWHNRALHDAFGIAEGLTVARGRNGALTVAPGTAYDSSGCPLVLHRVQEIAPPAFDQEPEPRVLVLRRATPSRETACCGERAARPPWQAIELVWLAPAAATPAEGVPLAVVEPGDAGLRIRNEVRPPARPERQPLIGAGATVPGETDWRIWFDPRHSRAHGIEVTVDTSAAGFTRTPCYFAWLQVATPGNLGFFTPYWERIVHPAATSFTFSLWIDIRPRVELLLVSQPSLFLVSFLPMIARRELSVCWLGLQPDRPASPSSGKRPGAGDHVII